MRFEAGGFEAGKFEVGFEPQTALYAQPIAKWSTMYETTDTTQERLALEARLHGLQALVGELLWTNQELRLELAKIKEEKAATAPATHPPLHPIH